MKSPPISSPVPAIRSPYRPRRANSTVSDRGMRWRAPSAVRDFEQLVESDPAHEAVQGREPAGRPGCRRGPPPG